MISHLNYLGKYCVNFGWVIFYPLIFPPLMVVFVEVVDIDFFLAEIIGVNAVVYHYGKQQLM